MREQRGEGGGPHESDAVTRAEPKPSPITWLRFEGQYRRRSSVVNFNRLLIVEHLTNPKANLRGFVGVRQALHLDDDRRLSVVPGKIKVGITRPRRERFETRRAQAVECLIARDGDCCWCCDCAFVPGKRARTSTMRSLDV
jgi:hypothetical protein